MNTSRSRSLSVEKLLSWYGMVKETTPIVLADFSLMNTVIYGVQGDADT